MNPTSFRRKPLSVEFPLITPALRSHLPVEPLQYWTMGGWSGAIILADVPFRGHPAPDFERFP